MPDLKSKQSKPVKTGALNIVCKINCRLLTAHNWCVCVCTNIPKSKNPKMQICNILAFGMGMLYLGVGNPAVLKSMGSRVTPHLSESQTHQSSDCMTLAK